jgi:hypothetical protein
MDVLDRHGHRLGVPGGFRNAAGKRFSDQPRASHYYLADILFTGDGFIIIAFPEIHTNKGQEVKN